MSIIAIWDGGLAIHGGILGGLLFGLVYCKVEHYQLLHLSDIILPNVLLAQAIGRWGNYFNQEAYGNVVSERYFDGIMEYEEFGRLSEPGLEEEWIREMIHIAHEEGMAVMVHEIGRAHV